MCYRYLENLQLIQKQKNAKTKNAKTKREKEQIAVVQLIVAVNNRTNGQIVKSHLARGHTKEKPNLQVQM